MATIHSNKLRYSKYNNVMYSSPKLQFVSMFEDYRDNFILYKSHYSFSDNIKELIINIINTYLKQQDMYISRFYQYNTKFIDYDELVSKLLNKYEDYDSDKLLIDIDIKFNINNFDLTSYVYNNEAISGLTINSNSELYICDEDIHPTFGETVTDFLTLISKKTKSVLDEVFNTDFVKIENYLNFLTLNHNDSVTNKLESDYKNFEVSMTELSKFNKTEMEFAEIDSNNEDFNNFINIIENAICPLSLKYGTYKFGKGRFSNKPSLLNMASKLSANTVNRLSTNDDERESTLSIYVPLLNSYFDFENLKIGNDYKYYSKSYESYKHDNVFKKIIRLCFYLMKKNNNFNKFKDEYEKLILK